MTIHQWRERDDHSSQAPVTALLCAAAAPTEPGPQPGEEAAVAAFRARVHSHRRRSMHSFTPVKAALAAAVTGGVLLTGGVAAAATGTLPGAAQDTARDVLSHVGVTVPGAAEQSGDHADERGPVPAGTPGAKVGGATDEEHAHGSTEKGQVVSKIAKDDPSRGVEHGAAVSTYASGGQSKAGQHGKAEEQHGKAGAHSDHSAQGLPEHHPNPTNGQSRDVRAGDQPTDQPAPRIAPTDNGGSAGAGGTSGTAPQR